MAKQPDTIVAPLVRSSRPSDETSKNRRLKRLHLGRFSQSGGPPRQRGAPVPVEYFNPDLQQEVSANKRPLHLLLFDEAFADHLIDGESGKIRGLILQL
jgi:hypothetical protein